jgi:hypothetical protein
MANSPFLCEEIPPQAEPKCLIAGRSDEGKGEGGRALTQGRDDLEDCVEVIHSQSSASNPQEIFDTLRDGSLDGAAMNDLVSNPSDPLVCGQDEARQVSASAKIWVDQLQRLLGPSHPYKFSWSDRQNPILELKNREHVGDVRVQEFLWRVSGRERSSQRP